MNERFSTTWSKSYSKSPFCLRGHLHAVHLAVQLAERRRPAAQVEEPRALEAGFDRRSLRQELVESLLAGQRHLLQIGVRLDALGTVVGRAAAQPGDSLAAVRPSIGALGPPTRLAASAKASTMWAQRMKNFECGILLTEVSDQLRPM